MAYQPSLPLTKRERQCLSLLAIGMRTKEIAKRLGIADKTVENHTTSARKRLGASTSIQAVVIAIKMGIIVE
jgi:DNA-binding CsgD family transcriptional regulator